MIPADTRFLSAVLLVSRDPPLLAGFYRDVLGMPLRDEQHGGGLPHYGCQLGDVHFAIHPLESFSDAGAEYGGVGGGCVMALATFDLDGLLARLATHGFRPEYPPREAGFARMSAVRDPEGRLVELTQLSESWLRYLETQRGQSGDLLAAASAASTDKS